MRIKECTDDEIITAVKNGNTNLFGEIMRRYNQRMYRTAIAFGIQDADCEDLIQKSYIAAFEKLYQFEGKAKFSTWLLRILINECLMYKRKIKKDAGKFISTENLYSQVKSIDPVKTPQNILEEKERLELIENEIKNLPEKYRTVYLMREVEEMGLSEIAECLNISEINAKVRLYRAKTILRNFLKVNVDRKEILTFGNARCDRVVENVLTHIGNAQLRKDRSFENN